MSGRTVEITWSWVSSGGRSRIAALAWLLAMTAIGVGTGVGLANLARGHRETTVSTNSSTPIDTSAATVLAGSPGTGLTADSGTKSPTGASGAVGSPAGSPPVVDPAAAPGVPGAVNASLSDRGSEILVTLRWAGADGHGRPVMGYSVRLFHSGDFDLSTQVAAASATFHVPCGGGGCADHPFVATASVRASNAAGTGPERTGSISGDLPRADLACSGDTASEVLCNLSQTAAGDRIDWVLDGTAAQAFANGANIVLPCAGVPVHTITVTVTNGAGTAVRTYTTNAVDCR
jgi:hypothetical protein